MADPISHLNTALEGRYRIGRELGEGGMATVYLADDLRHERRVALKVLKPELAAVVGAERFLAEIKTTANLQHPHILPLFDSGEADGFLFYVMPYVEGESLRDRLERENQLPVEEAVAIAMKVAGALEAAHDQGVIHRDIKPANILLAKGEPLVTDFGIALAVGAAGGGRLTETGLSLGTPHYMSPEQATGDPTVGPASDIYALGCVLYEMLAGQPPYTGTSAQAVVGKIIAGAPVSIRSERASVPTNVDGSIRRALERIPADRFASASDFSTALSNPHFRHGPGVRTGPQSAGVWKRLSIGLAAATLVSFVWAFVSQVEDSPDAVLHFELVLNGSQIAGGAGSGVDLTISPDGNRIIYRGSDALGGEPRLWSRSLDDLNPRALPGTVGKVAPVIGHDGGLLAFTGDGISTLRLDGGVVTDVAADGTNVELGHDGRIYFRLGGTGSIWRQPLEGGEPERFTEPIEGVDQRYPDALSDGLGFLLTLNREDDLQRSTIGVVGPEGGEVTELLPGAMARYATSGHLLFTDADGRLMAASFDPRSRTVRGPAVEILTGIQVKTSSASQFAVSESGTLAYITRASAASFSVPLLAFDPAMGIDTLSITPRDFGAVRWSPDGAALAFSGAQAERDIFVLDLGIGTGPRQLTFEGTNIAPVWSPTGDHIAYSSTPPGADDSDLFVVAVDSDLPGRRILDASGQQVPRDWTNDGLIVFESWQPASPGDLWMVDPATGEAAPYLESSADLDDIVVSPDGLWAAYQSDETGTEQVYIRRFPEPGQPTLISSGEGQFPRWSSSGRTLYYWSGSGGVGSVDTLFAVDLQTDPAIAIVGRRELVAGNYLTEVWDLHPSEDKIVLRPLTSPADSTAVPRMFVYHNFFEQLMRLVPN